MIKFVLIDANIVLDRSSFGINQYNFFDCNTHKINSLVKRKNTIMLQAKDPLSPRLSSECPCGVPNPESDLF